MIDLSNIDFSKVARRDLTSLAQSCVEDIQQKTGKDFLSAWADARQSYPQLFARMASLNGDIGGVTGTEPAASPSLSKSPLPLPIASDQAMHNLGLPRDVAPDIFQRAWNLNGGKATPLDAGKVYDGLVSYLQKKAGITVEAAQASAAMAFPRLSQLKMAQSGAKQLAATLPAASRPGVVSISAPESAPQTQRQPRTSAPPPAEKKNFGLSVGNEKAMTVSNEDQGFLMHSFVGSDGKWDCVF